MRHQKRAHLGVMIAIVLLSVSAHASAETLLLMMDSGPADKELIESVADRLEGAGLSVQISSASLDDSALLLGCEPEEDDCLELVAKTGGADSILVLPAAEGLLIARRGQKRRSAQAPESAHDEAGWRAALEKSLDLDLTPDTAASTEVADSDAGKDTADSLPPPADGTQAADATTPGIDSSMQAESSLVAEPASGSPLSRVRRRSWVVLGSGAAVGGLGLMFLGIASSKQDKVNAHPIDSVADFDALADLEASGENFTLVGNIALVGGGLAMLAGVGLVVWDSRKAPEQQALTIAPSIATESVGLTLSWSSP